MRIAIYTGNLSGLAGIERVVREHLRIFASHGAVCEVFGEAGCAHCVPARGIARREAVRALLEAFHPDVCLLHGVSHVGVGDDVATLRELGIPVVAVCHFSFPSALLLDGDEGANRVFLRGARLCDAVATVSSIDARWWRAAGCRAFHVQNPFVHPKMNPGRVSARVSAPRHALWVGRQAQQKQPSAALAAFAAVTRAVPEAHLTMVGGSQKGWGPLRRKARALGIERQVTFLPARDDLSELWDWADFHLLSSVTESFCLVLAEAKARGLPTVMFEIPFLELVGDGRGLLTAPQGDVRGLAEAMLRLMREPGLCERLGAEAKESLADFNDDAVWESWQRLFAALRTGEGGREVASDLRTVVAQTMAAWDNFCDRNLWAVSFAREWSLLTHTSWRPIARGVASLVRAVRALKARLRR